MTRRILTFLVMLPFAGLIVLLFVILSIFGDKQ